MKLTELIQELQTIHGELGECDVYVNDETILSIEPSEEPDLHIDNVFIYSKGYV